MKHLTLTTISLLCAAAAPLCAGNMGTKKCCPQTKQQQCCPQTRQHQCMHDEITPSAEPAVTRTADPFVTADFILWRASQEGMDYAFNGVTDELAAPIRNADRGSMKHPDFSYQPGFKLGTGVKFCHDGWDLFAQYTWLQVDDAESSVRRDRDGDSDVYSNIATTSRHTTLGAFTAEKAKATWNLHLNVLDLELGRNFWISKWLTMRPFVGMKFDWTDQNFNVVYTNIHGNPLVRADLAGDNWKMKMDQDQWAAGLRAGLNTTWYMWKKWAIFGELALSGMLNDFDVTRKDRVHRANGQRFTHSHVDRDIHNVTAILEWSLGLRYETAFHCDDYLFMVQAGWEQQVWFGQNQFVYFLNNNSNGNLSFQGLTVKAGFYF